MLALPLLSVVVPAHNPEPSLTRAVQSVQANLPACEIVIVDDGSTLRPAAQILSQMRGVRVISQEQRGPAAARNTGARAATHDWLLFLDDDDEILPGILNALHLAREGAGVVYGGYVVVRGGETKVHEPVQDASLGHAISPIAGSFLVSRRVFDGCGGYDEQLRFSENTDLAVRACARSRDMGLTVHSTSTPIVKYLAQANEAQYDLRRLRAAEHILERGRPDLVAPQRRSELHAIAAVNASREALYWTALTHSWSAVAAVPSVDGLLRLVLSCTGPLGRLWWRRGRSGSPR